MNKYISSGPILTLSPRESTYVLLTSLFDSNLANFDEMFAPKWSSKDLIIESIKLITRDSWFYPSISEDNKLTKIQSWTTKQNNSEFGQVFFFFNRGKQEQLKMSETKPDQRNYSASNFNLDLSLTWRLFRSRRWRKWNASQVWSIKDAFAVFLHVVSGLFPE